MSIHTTGTPRKEKIAQSSKRGREENEEDGQLEEDVA